MSFLKIKLLTNETQKFFKKYLIFFIKIILNFSIIYLIIEYLTYPYKEILVTIIKNIIRNNNFNNFFLVLKHLTIKEKFFMNYYFFIHKIITLTNFSLIVIITISIIIIDYNKKKNVINSIFKYIFYNFPILFIMFFIINIILEYSFIIGVFYSIIILFLLLLFPIIRIIEKKSIFDSVVYSIKLVWSHKKIIFPIFFIYIIVKFLLLIFDTILLFNYSYLLLLIFNIINNFITIIFIIYLTKCYLLVKNIHNDYK
ncbi:hypothetical protein GJT81_00490 [Enterobacteriaceae endosymbiont of Plateumaris consimilis]|uniref:YciC family protein n=1 Tax=Enterobacteriaceae endosymbiont of Plateumaris consimilis TaxID=2675794 RepID=UPI001449E3EB|nr:YciC family protein [Enterobacteriaceae endosymbiont of Plateumaris consimilis]QJC28509.1 hypothetical protein GJT81_00490 [Enterobacteriaceae endosymbiont of Plateumaris consimilis]